MALTDHWPLFGLRLRTPRLELRYVDDELAAALIDVTLQGIHDPAAMPFGVPWTDLPAGGPLERSSLQHHWSKRATWAPDDWFFDMAVLVDGRPVGAQALFASQFPRLKTVETGSWLGRAHQGQGIGKEMRAAILHLAFAGLDAEVARTGAWHDNHASLAVTRALGYLPNGEERRPRRDAADRMLLFRLPRERWAQSRRDDIIVEGLDACRPLFAG